MNEWVLFKKKKPRRKIYRKMMGKTAQWGKIVKKCLRKFMVKKTIVNRNYANWILFFSSFRFVNIQQEICFCFSSCASEVFLSVQFFPKKIRES